MNLKDELVNLLERYCKEEGTNIRGAVRDTLTELRHISDDEELDFGIVDGDAYEVYREELDLKRNEG